MSDRSHYYGIAVTSPDTSVYPLLIPFSTFNWWDNFCQQGQINPSPGVFDWTHFDQVRALLLKSHITDGMFQLSPVAPWIIPTLGVGKNQPWRDWVAAAGTHMKGSKHRIAGYCPQNEFNNPAGVWHGTPAQLVRMSQDARCILTGRGTVTDTGETAAQVLATVGLTAPIDPTVVMLCPSFGIYNPSGRIAYFNTPGALAATEAINFHAYEITADLCVSQFKTVAGLFPGLDIWVGETAWRATDTLTYPEKVAWITALFSTAPSQVVRIYMYSYNSPKYADLEEGGVLTPAGVAYANLPNLPNPTKTRVAQRIISVK
jgi:hypothetical protein